MLIIRHTFICFIIIWHFIEVKNWEEIYDKDGDLSLNDLTIKLGFEGLESHSVLTSDGYTLNIFRIKRKGAEKLMPVLLVHGLSGCADSFFVNKNDSAPIVMANNGYDVWLLNARGTKNSFNHSTWKGTTDREFWMYSWQEIGLFDLPLGIDMALKNNVHDKIILLGHSEGSTVIFVTLSELPQYNAKVALSIHWGVSVFHESCASVPIMTALCKWDRVISEISDGIGLFSFNQGEQARQLLRDICKFPLFKQACFEIAKICLQSDEQIQHVKDWSFIVGLAACGGSTRELFHYMQVGNSGRFARYDYGPNQNMKIYNSTEPPLFHLENVNSTLLLWCGKNDIFCSKNDINQLVKRVGARNVEPASFRGQSIWAHNDFLLGRDLKPLVYVDLLKIMKKYST